LANIAIDRIYGLKETSKSYEPLDDDYNFEEYFGDVVGVYVGVLLTFFISNYNNFYLCRKAA